MQQTFEGALPSHQRNDKAFKYELGFETCQRAIDRLVRPHGTRWRAKVLCADDCHVRKAFGMKIARSNGYLGPRHSLVAA